MKTRLNKLQIILLFLLQFSATIHAQDLVWAKQFAGAPNTGSLNAPIIALDKFGNTYTTDTFFGTIDVDPGPNIFSITAVTPVPGSSGYGDIFVSKFNSSGDFLWAKKIGGNEEDSSAAIGLDGEGNVYISGCFSGTTDFDPGPAVFNLSSGSSFNGFICKLDTNGDFIWAKQFGGSQGYVQTCLMSVSESGNLCVTGAFGGTVDFDPGADSFNLSGEGPYDIYVSSLDSSGNLLWAKRIGGNSEDRGTDIVHDKFGDIYMATRFFGTVDFDPSANTLNLTTTPGQGSDVCFLKLNSAGDFLWAKQLNGINVASIATDSLGNLYTTGSFFSLTGLDFDPGSGTAILASVGNYGDIFMTKLDQMGNHIWAKKIGSEDYEYSREITLDQYGNVFLVGLFSGTVDFDPGDGVFNLTAFPGSSGFDTADIFVSKLDAIGNFIWARKMGGNGVEDMGTSIALDRIGNTYVAGTFRGLSDFDPNAGTFNLTAQGFRDGFICKLSSGNTISLVGSATQSNNFETDYLMTTTDSVNYSIANVFLSTAGDTPTTLGQVKFRMNNTWTVNWGAIPFPAGTGIQDGPNITVNQAGFYNVSLNALSGAYTFTLINPAPTISLIGSNIGTAWTTDLNLTSTTGKFYSLPNTSFAQGLAKFRQDGSWLVNWGNTTFPAGVGFQDGPNIPIAAGTYDVSFNRFTGGYQFTPSLGIEDFANSKALLYPNPAQNTFIISHGDTALGNVRVCDVLGKVLFATSSQEKELTVDCSAFPNGVYFVTLSRENEQTVKKLVVKR